MEFKTGELEARLNRKEQMIAKLENDLREVSFYAVVIVFSFFSFICFCFKWCDAKYTRSLAKSTQPYFITMEDFKSLFFVLSRH